jgi:hypothetical protein
VEKGNPDKGKDHSQVPAAGGVEKWGKKQRGHTNSPGCPCDTVNFYHGITAGKYFPKGQKKERYIEHCAEDAYESCIGFHSQGKEGNYVACQKIPGKGIKNVKNII